MTFTDRDIDKAARAIWIATGHRASDWVYMAPETERPQRYRGYARAALAATADSIAAQALEAAGDAPLPAPGRKGETSGFRFWLRARAAATRGDE